MTAEDKLDLTCKSSPALFNGLSAAYKLTFMSNSEMWQRIRAARKHAKLTQEQLGERCGVSKAAVAQWEAKTPDKRTSPSRESVYKIHQATGAPVEWLYDDAANAEGGWMAATGAGDVNLGPAPRNRGMVPLISWVRAGEMTEAVDLYSPGDAEDWLPCPQFHGEHTFALRVQGDSMTSPYPGQRTYPEGSLIYVDPDATLTNGRRVVAKLTDSGEVTFKVYAEDAGKRYLKPLNPQYPTIELHNGHEIVGVVIGSYLPE